MIRSRPYGQIGNQMFQYCMGRILALRTGQPYVPPRCWCDSKKRPVTWSGEPLWKLASVEGRTVSGRPQEINVGNWFEPESIDPDMPVDIVTGYFQRYELLKPYKEAIRNDWLKIPEHRYVETDDAAVYVHVRRKDYVGNPTCTPTSIPDFADCIRQFPEAKKLVIATDDRADQFLSGFDSIGLPWSVSGLPWDQDFLLLASCRWLVISQSTYSWWAGFLGRPERIVCAVKPGSLWHRGLENRDRPNLYVDDEPNRWIWLKE